MGMKEARQEASRQERGGDSREDAEGMREEE